LLPAILTLGSTPYESLLAKFLWFLRCLGCPFTGLYYFCNIEGNPIEMSAYWLESKNFIHFIRKKNDDQNDNKNDDKNDDGGDDNYGDYGDEGYDDNDDDEDDDDEDDETKILINNKYDDNEVDDNNKDDDEAKKDDKGYEEAEDGNGDGAKKKDDKSDDDDDNNFNEESSKNTTKIETKIAINNNKDEVDNKVISEQDFPRPFGYHVMKIKPNKSQKRILEDWIAKASLLDRLLLFFSAYYIIISIIAGITKAVKPCTQDNSLGDWPYIPILFAWILPVIYVRMFKGKVVCKVLPERLKNRITIVKYNPAITKTKQNWVFAIFCFSLFLPWLSVFITYWIPPIGFSCKCKFLTVICSIWSFNNIVAYASHMKGEKDVHGPSPIGVMFICFGTMVGLGLIFFETLWESAFGASCNQFSCL
ncbi:24857_t:CDS:2, partial [Gigaspora rosea]